jgi:hypothetical protein
MYEYWSLIENSFSRQQAERGSYNPLINVILKEIISRTANFTFQMLPSTRFGVNDIHNSK